MVVTRIPPRCYTIIKTRLYIRTIRYPRICHSNADNLDNLTHRASMCLSINKLWSRLTPNRLSLFNESITSPYMVKSREIGKNLRF